MPEMGESGSIAIGLTVSLAPITSVTSVLAKSSLISSISRTTDGVDCEADVDSTGAEHGDDFGEGVLRLGDGHAVADDDDDTFRVLEGVYGILDAGGCDLAFDLLLGLGRRGETTEENVGERPVHGYTHDIRKNGTTDTDEGADAGEKRVVEHQALGHECKAGVSI